LDRDAADFGVITAQKLEPHDARTLAAKNQGKVIQAGERPFFRANQDVAGQKRSQSRGTSGFNFEND
jgi:hypothetical protein